MDPTLAPQILAWFDTHARDLPWRRPSTSPWGVMVSEFMLQQTPVARVLEPYDQWLRRWPTPAALAADSPGEAVRAWGRLGYPRRALRLHAAATAIVAEHGGEVPRTPEALRALPGVGSYTAAAIAAFAFGERIAVLDTNVRRVHTRLLDGAEFPASTSATVRETERADALLASVSRDEAAALSVAVMELGALLCTANNPSCHHCPVAASCAWRGADYPPYAGKPRRGQTYAGTDRQCRGRILELLRRSEGAVSAEAIAAVWNVEAQRVRCLTSLLDDGLACEVAGGYALPGHSTDS